jgi:predicted transcriptional regulator
MMKNNKHVRLDITVNKEDIVPVFAQCVRLILARKTKKQEEVLLQMDKDLEAQDQESIYDTLSEYIGATAQEAQELQMASEILKNLESKVWGSGVDRGSSSETEVLEDLPDLKEDGLGIDSGGE